MSERQQYMTALAQGNRVRLARAALKRKIRSGAVTVADVIGPDTEIPFEAETMSASELLAAQTRWGVTRARKCLLRLAIGESRELGSLTARERARLVEAFKLPLPQVADRRSLAA